MNHDYLIVADRAEAVNGKLYLMGGGWDRLGLTAFPGNADFDVAVGILVGYNETNEPHKLEVTLETDDNNVVLGPIGAQFEMGKPPGMKKGQAQRFQMVLRGPFTLPAPGAYHWVVMLDGQRAATTDFWADKVALPLAPNQAPPR